MGLPRRRLEDGLRLGGAALVSAKLAEAREAGVELALLAVQQQAEAQYALGEAREALATLDDIQARYGKSRTHRISQSMHHWRLRAAALARALDRRRAALEHPGVADGQLLAGELASLEGLEVAKQQAGDSYYAPSMSS